LRNIVSRLSNERDAENVGLSELPVLPVQLVRETIRGTPLD
jgi:hypothetical protein